MKEYYGDKFQQIKTHGNKGSMKVDGVLDGYTVFAPFTLQRCIRIENVVNNVFLKHKNNGIWKYISKWTFIVKNNQRKGVTSRVMDLISRLRD